MSVSTAIQTFSNGHTSNPLNQANLSSFRSLLFLPSIPYFAPLPWLLFCPSTSEVSISPFHCYVHYFGLPSLGPPNFAPRFP